MLISTVKASEHRPDPPSSNIDPAISQNSHKYGQMGHFRQKLKPQITSKIAKYEFPGWNSETWASSGYKNIEMKKNLEKLTGKITDQF